MTENEKWDAVISNNAAADNYFYYAVKSTGIFCRPSCKSKQPIRENVQFFDSREDVLAAGYRPCKRCRPELEAYQPLADIAEQARIVIEQCYANKQQREDKLQKLGVSNRRLTQIFAKAYGVSPIGYLNNYRIQIAMDQLQQSTLPIIEIAYSIGFIGLSSFYANFRRSTGMAPSEYRNHKEESSVPANGFYSVYDTALGEITIACNASSIVVVQFGSQVPRGIKKQRTQLTNQTAVELNEYFSGKRKSFDVPLTQQGTKFQKKVWAALCQIPYGETRTYKEIAEAIGRPNASRSIGMANNKNPIQILIPCHRVIGANGLLVGYAGGIDNKEKLLQLEQTIKPSIYNNPNRKQREEKATYAQELL